MSDRVVVVVIGQRRVCDMFTVLQSDIPMSNTQFITDILLSEVDSCVIIIIIIIGAFW
jgi:hypothetical protein